MKGQRIIATRRKFGGKMYKLYGSYRNKSNAKKRATGFRLGGEPARVVEETKGEWTVYVRSPGSKR